MKLHRTLFIYLFLTFIGFTVIGTLSHELGHFAVAKYLGYTPRINYASTFWLNENDMEFLSSTTSKYHNQLKQNIDFPEKDKYFALSQQISRDSQWITIGGPLQTMLTGTIGLLLLFVLYKPKMHSERLPLKIWILVFSALFWLRQTANLCVFYASYFLKGSFSVRGDEAKLSMYSDLPVWTFNIVTGIIGAVVLVFILFKIVPKQIRFPFMLAGLSGGVFGYILWLIIVGPIVMP